MRTTTILCVALASLASTASAAVAEPLAVKTGLWSMTTRMHIQGPLLSPETLAKLPPQARAQVQAVMGNLTQPHETKTCLTEEKLRRGFDFQKNHGKCEPHVITQSSTTMEVEADCAEPHGNSHMHAHFTAADAETIQGTFEVDRAAAEGPKHIDAEVTGKFLGATCTGTED